jgi:hypothetical protein
MLRSDSRPVRFLVVIFAIVAMLCVSAASVSATHSHVKEPVDRCGVCYTAHMAAEQVAVLQILHRPELRILLAAPVTIHRIESRSVLALLTRGPPSFLQ